MPLVIPKTDNDNPKPVFNGAWSDYIVSDYTLSKKLRKYGVGDEMQEMIHLFNRVLKFHRNGGHEAGLETGGDRVHEGFIVPTGLRKVERKKLNDLMNLLVSTYDLLR